ncbi:unnamed protein product, partial [Symbiodinium sp. KB8]
AAADGSEKRKKLTYVSQAEFKRLLVFGRAVIATLATHAFEDARTGAHVRGKTAAERREAGAGTTAHPQGSKAALKSSHRARMHCWRQIWGEWASASGEGHKIRARMIAQGVPADAVDYKAVESLDKKFKTQLPKALAAQKQAAQESTADSTTVQGMEATGNGAAFMSPLLVLVLDFAKHFRCVNTGLDLAAILKRFSYPAPGGDQPSPPLEGGSGPLLDAEASPCISHTGPAAEGFSPKVEEAAGLASTGACAAAACAASDVASSAARETAGKRDRDRISDGRAAKRLRLRDLLKQERSEPRDRFPHVREELDTVLHGDVHALARLVAHVGDSSPIPILLARGLTVHALVKELQVCGLPEQLGKILPSLSSFTPALVESLSKGRRLAPAEAQAFGARFHDDLAVWARNDSSIALLLRKASKSAATLSRAPWGSEASPNPIDLPELEVGPAASSGAKQSSTSGIGGDSNSSDGSV